MDFLIFNLISVGIAVILDLIFGDPYGFPHPVIYMGKLIKALEKKFRKASKSDRELKNYGGLIFIIVVFVVFILSFGVLYLFSFNKILLLLGNSFLLYTTLAAKCLKDEANKVYDALREKNIEKARVRVSYIVGRDTTELNEKEIIRATVETVAENASDGVIAPMFYGLIGGAPLAMVYKGINTMDSMLGYLTEEFKYIGYFPAKLDDVANFLPARITGVMMCFCAPFFKGSVLNSLKIMWRDRKNHKSPNCAYPEGAAAGVFKIQLGGTNVYFGEVIYKPTIGDNINTLEINHIKKCNRLMIGSEILFYITWCIMIGVIELCQRL
ncbi:MAG: adenosylcobinamide-phosphate synthase CbiB [Clostridium sp.]